MKKVVQELRSIGLLRVELRRLRAKRDEIILEKGLAGRDDNDLRENSLYEYLRQQEELYTFLIIKTLQEIKRLSSVG